VTPATASGRFVGVVARRGRFLVLEPLFERGPQANLARGSIRVRAEEMVLAERHAGGARALERLGRPDRPTEVTAALMLERGLERGFDPALTRAADRAAVEAREADVARRDLRELATFTVDPASAHDFDDAVSARREGDEVRLWIHIADVCAHVRPGSGLEAEALRRANSTYVPGAVEPMLPRELSAGACSLAPGTDRLAVTSELVLGPDGRPRKTSFYRSLIRSDARLDYDELDRLFAGDGRPPEAIAEPLDGARSAAAALAEKRSRGSLEVSTAEPEFEFDSEGAVVRARSVAQTESHRLIEQLMIVTNERVAELCQRRGSVTLYRVHERPDPPRVAVLFEQLAALDLPTPAIPESFSATEASELVAAASRMVGREAERRGHGRAAYTSLVLRSLKQAYYSHRNTGHAGLGSPAYAHFTSPIRRYPDLIAHRALLALIGAGETEPERGAVREAGWWCSQRERESVFIERDADRVCAAFLLERELFESGWSQRFAGEVSGVIAAGAFVRFGGELGDVYEGFVPVRRLRAERFDLNPTETSLVGRRSGREIRVGDPLDVRVDSVEAPRGRVDLSPMEVEG
jgi:ribonuclease R